MYDMEVRLEEKFALSLLFIAPLLMVYFPLYFYYHGFKHGDMDLSHIILSALLFSLGFYALSGSFRIYSKVKKHLHLEGAFKTLILPAVEPLLRQIALQTVSMQELENKISQVNRFLDKISPTDKPATSRVQSAAFQRNSIALGILTLAIATFLHLTSSTFLQAYITFLLFFGWWHLITSEFNLHYSIRSYITLAIFAIGELLILFFLPTKGVFTNLFYTYLNLTIIVYAYYRLAFIDSPRVIIERSFIAYRTVRHFLSLLIRDFVGSHFEYGKKFLNNKK